MTLFYNWRQPKVNSLSFRLWNWMLKMRSRKTFVLIVLTAALIFILLLAAAPLLSHRALGDYTDPAGPLFQGFYSDGSGVFSGSLRVVTWNLFYGDRLEAAIQTLVETPELQNADVLLFQEIDAAGVEEIARRLNYNYIFYPTILDHQRRIEYGDAILSKWPLSNPSKLVLPVFFPGWLESRSSTGAIMTVAGREIIVHSTHLDITWMIFRRGESQADSLSKGIGLLDQPVILGGDFNTWIPISIALLEKVLGKIGLQRLSKGTGYTFEWSRLQLTLDHLFSNTALDHRSGVYRQTNASDHFPVWAEMTIDLD